MVSEIVKDIFFLGQKSVPATKDDLDVADKLIDTLEANKDKCVGLAANMIGIKKNIIIANIHENYVVMFNPVIVKKDKEYDTREGCLSLDGERECKRFKSIEVEFYDVKWKKRSLKLSGFSSQIVQHEIDHTNGIII